MGYGTSLGTAHEDEISYTLEKVSEKKFSDLQEINANNKSGDFQSRFYATDQSTMPLEASRKLTDALKLEGGRVVAPEANASPEPSYGDPGFFNKLLYGKDWVPKKDPETPEGQTQFETNSGLKITDKDIQGATDVAMSFGTGTMAGVKSAGIKAKLADLGHAQVLEANGIHADDIFTTTGFHRGKDGRWRYEIDDSKAKFFPDNLKAFTRDYVAGERNTPALLSDVYAHPELYKAYPHLKNVKVFIDPEMVGAQARAQGPNQYIALGGKSFSDGRVASKDQGVLAHEVQHFIQEHEGFAKGATFEGPGNSEAAKYYLRSAGETEARNVDTRLLMGEKHRRSVPPTWTEDLPRSQQISTKGVGMGTEQGLEDTMTGALTRMKEAIFFRRAANENFAPGDPRRPYNIREPNMIGSKEADDAIDAAWASMVEKSRRAESIAADQAKLLRESLDKGWNDISKKKYEKLSKEYDKLYPPEKPVKVSPELQEKVDKIVKETMERKMKLTPEQRAAERDLNNRAMKNPERVNEDALYAEMEDLLSVKSPSNLQKDRITQLNKMLDDLESQ